MQLLRHNPRNPYKSSTPPLTYRGAIAFIIGVIICVAYFWRSTADPATTYLKGMATPETPIPKQTFPPLVFKVMSFNLRYASADDGINSWDFRKFHLFDIIDRYHPAVMGTQEGLKDQLAEIVSSLRRNYKMFGVEREENGEYAAIFHDDDILERVDGGHFWLGDDPNTPGIKSWGAPCVRMVSWCKFRIRATGQYFYFFNTQFDHVSEESRQKSSHLLTEKIREITDPTLPLFLVGDFNTNRDTYAWEYLNGPNGPGVADAWHTAEKQIGSVSYTYHGWRGLAKEDGSPRASNHIDWILFRPTSIRTLKTEIITEDMYGRYPSDHYPVQSEFIFPSE